jgi:AbrB family looped-hinge helix DNA binding protein
VRSVCATVLKIPEESSMPVLRIDGQGRIVIPLAERRRLGLVGGDPVELIPTYEGLLIEPRREATVRIAADGLPVLEFTDGRSISTEELLAAIDADRDAR